MSKRAEEHTIVVRYEEEPPRYHASMKFEGGDVVAVDFCGNRLRVEAELLDALTALLDALDANGSCQYESLRDDARAVIAKATGADYERD